MKKIIDAFPKPLLQDLIEGHWLPERGRKGSALDTGQIEQVIEKNILLATADNTILARIPFGKSQPTRDFANPKHYLLVAGREIFRENRATPFITRHS